MTIEVRLAFLIFFFFLWTLSAMLPWAAVAVWKRGQGGLLALPLAVTAAWAGGVIVPAVGLRDLFGFLLSLVTSSAAALCGSLLGVTVSARIAAHRPAPLPTRTPPLTRRPSGESAETTLDPPSASR